MVITGAVSSGEAEQAQNGAGVEIRGTTTADDDGEGGGAVTDEELFEVLSNRRRRYALHYLLQHEDDPVAMGDLSTQVAAWEADVDPDAVTYDQRKSVHTSLYQYHAPKLDDAGLVDYNSERGIVELTAEGAEVDLYLEAVRGREIPWSSYFLGLSAGAAVLVSAGWLGVPFLAALPEFTLAGFTAAAFLFSSLVFAYDTRTAMRLGSDGPPPEVTDE